MAQQGAALQSYNNELVKSLEELIQRRAALNKQIEAETNEKLKLETEKKRLDERLASVETSLQSKLNTKAEYDKVIGDAEQVNVLKVKLMDLVFFFTFSSLCIQNYIILRRLKIETIKGAMLLKATFTPEL